MKKLLVFTAIFMFVAFSAFAEAPTSRAIGYDGNVGGLSYRCLKYSLGFQGILGIGYNAPAASTMDADIDLSIGVNVLKSMWECDKGQLNGFAGVSIMMDGSSVKDSDSVTDIGIAVGLEPEIFLLDNLSVSTKFGVMIGINGETRGGDGKSVKDSGSTTFGTYGQGVSIVNGVSFNWYF